MSFAESMLLVRPEHLNHHGFLFGGRLLEWLDEQAYIAAIALMDPAANLVTVGIDRVEFHHQVLKGSVLRFRSLPVHLGRSSLTVHTAVALAPEMPLIFEAYVTFVALDRKGAPRAVRPLLLRPIEPRDEEGRRRWQEVEAARALRRAAGKRR